MSFRFGLIGACLLALIANSAFAQEDASKYPSRPIRIIVGFAAGGGNDVIARIYAQKLS
jgi:tripartite-type tricarboxylate transporter receptor subunit TctC